jgi:5'-phosphate synthase pdxT subunit
VPVGILALQGDVNAHRIALERVGIGSVEIRNGSDLLSTEGLVLPGGESTSIWKLMEGTGMEEAIRAFVGSGRPVLATCAGAILLAKRITHPDREGLGLLDVTANRNAYGRQLESAVVSLPDLDRDVLGKEPLEAVFIRAPKLTHLGPHVRVLARRDGDPVLIVSGTVVAATFHPELAADLRVHRLFLSKLSQGSEADEKGAPEPA